MTSKTTDINGIDTGALANIVQAVAADPAQGIARFEVTTTWKGGTRTDTHVGAWHLGGRRLQKDFTIRTDEPNELLGGNTAPNPQELLMAAYNACMTVGFTALCAVEGVELRSLKMETDGELDLRGFLGLDAKVKPGYDSLRTRIRVSASATPAKLKEIVDKVFATSPNRWNMGQPVRLETELIVE